MKVIYFDGFCGLCNGFVDFMMKIDQEKLFHYSPLQSDYAKKNLPEEFTKDLKSVVYSDGQNLYTKSAAVIKILQDRGGVWKLSSAGKFVPKVILDKAYDLVAENRYKVFGKKESCRLPTPEERELFIT